MTIEGVNRDVGYMTQDDALLPWRSVRSNVGLPLELRHHRDRRAQRAALVREHVRLVGLGGFEDYRPGQLSGGMRKRVALARTLICDPSVLLLDEPFAALDAQLRVVMQTELARLNSIKGKTVLLVTHDIAEAISLADRILVFSSRPARIVSEIAVDFERPRDIVQLQGDPRFGEIHKEVWDCLRPQLAASESSVAA
jgi:NitT/TauT family transport system ATP-binding protein